jgi:hypothetical protein
VFVHNVYFWLKPDSATASRDQLVEDCRRLLGNIPWVKKIYVGTPAGTPREVVDNSYDVAITVIFEDASGHDPYQTHELHTQFFNRNSPHWERVVVYDFVESANSYILTTVTQ